MSCFISICYFFCVIYCTLSLDVNLVKDPKDETKTNVVISGYDIAQFNRMNGEDPLSIIPGSFICTQVEFVNDEFYGKRPTCISSSYLEYTGITQLADKEYLVFKPAKSGADSVKSQISFDRFIEKIFEHNIAILEAKTKGKGSHWRLILPAPVSGEAHDDRMDIEIKWDHSFGRNQLDVTRFDVTKAGLQEIPRVEWYSDYERVHIPPLLTIRKGKPMLYFYEHGRRASRYSVTYENKHRWVPYAFHGMHTFRPKGVRRAKPLKDVLFLFKPQSKPMSTKILTLNDLVYRAARGLVAFDEEGKYLLIGKKKQKSVFGFKQKAKETDKQEKKHVRFDLSAKQDIFGDKLDDDAYYNEYYYEDVTRLLKLAMANRN
eukprot:67197_1